MLYMLIHNPLSLLTSPLLASNLVLLLDARGGHAVDDRVTARVHVADGQADGQQREEHDHAEPQDDVEHDGVGLGVLLGQVDCVLLQINKKRKQNYSQLRLQFTPLLVHYPPPIGGAQRRCHVGGG